MFTAEDDEILLDWVGRVRERGLPLWSKWHWQEFADKVKLSDLEQTNVNFSRIRVTVWNRGEGVINTILDTFGQTILKMPSQ
jgi:hypothetical protein